jgi:hypothetical protein
MKSFNSIVSKYADTKRILGKVESGLNVNQIDDLRKDLKSISSNNIIFYWICVGMVVTIFLLSIFLFIFNIYNCDKIEIILSINGVSIMGLIVYMKKLWKEKVNSDMLLVLIGTLKKEMINTILVALIKKHK